MSSDPLNFYSRTRSARKVIVVDLGFLGDSVHLIPALVEIKRHYPEAALHTLSAGAGAELLGLVPVVERAWCFPLGSPSPPWWRHWDLIRALRRERFDVAFNFSAADRTILLTALTGARSRLAHAAGQSHFWNPWLIPDWIPRADPALPVYEQRRLVLARCGFDLDPPRWDWRLPPEAIRRAESLVPSGSIHFSINASTPLKEWPLTHWSELARLVLVSSEHVRIVATGSANPREQDRLRRLAETLANKRLLLAPPGLTLAELAAVLQRCKLHVGADSGVLHLAMALAVPTIALFRDYPGKDEWLPRGTTHQHLLVPCECITANHPSCTNLGVARCLARIAPAEVLQLIRHLARGGGLPACQ